MHAIVVFLLDGLADRAHESLGGRSGLEAAQTPQLDRLCAAGSCGVLYAIGPGRAPSSEVAHWSMFGYRPDEFPGRAVFEALGRGQDVNAEHESLEDGATGELVGPVAEHRPVRDLAGGRASGADRVQHSTRARSAEAVELRRLRSFEPAAAAERLVRTVGKPVQQEDDDRVHSDRDALQRPDHTGDAGGNERLL